MNEARAAASALVLNDVLYVAGGTNRGAKGLAAQKMRLNTVESFDGTDWEALPSMTEARAYFGFAALGDDIYAAGGQGQDNYPTTCECREVQHWCGRRQR